MTYRSVVACVAVLLLAGCSAADDQADTDLTAVPETSSPTVSEPSAMPVALTDEMLLVASEMPAWNDAGTWRTIDDSEVLRACSLPDAESLGAALALTRTFEYVVEIGEGETQDPDAEPMLGINVVAAWQDDAAATAAVEQWEAALDECSEGRGPIGAVEGGSTWTYSARDESSMNESWFDFVGVAAEGSTTTLVGFSLWGQDANYEGDPLAESMQASLDRLP